MHFHLPALSILLGLASLSLAQESEIDFAGDVPPECQQDASCAAAIYPAAQCPRNLNLPFSGDQTYLNCLWSQPNFCADLQQCYQCVGTYKREGDIKRIWQLCNTF